MPLPLTDDQKDILTDLYYDQKNYFGRDRLYELVKDDGISRRQVMSWLKDQEVAQLFKATRKSKDIQSTVLKAPLIQVAIDLMDMGTLAHDGYHWILTAVDCFSKKAWAEPLKNKEGKTVADAMGKIINEMPQPPQSLRSDRGSEFLSDYFQRLLARHKIKQVLSLANRPESNGQVERFNGTIKRLIKMDRSATDNPDWISALPQLVANYNNTKHRVIQTTPTKPWKRTLKQPMP